MSSIIKILNQVSNGYRNVLMKKPLMVGMATTGTTAFLGDVVCQVIIEKKEYQIKRGLTLASWATFATGPFMYFWMRGLERVLPMTLAPPVRLAGKALLEMTVAFPIILGGFFGGVTLLQTHSLQAARNKIDMALWPTLKMGYSYFIPASLITHTVIPPQHRVLFLNFITFFWLIYLSNVQHRK